jgi:hypothetical protein
MDGSCCHILVSVVDETLPMNEMAEHVAYEAYMVSGTTQLIEQEFPKPRGVLQGGIRCARRGGARGICRGYGRGSEGFSMTGPVPAIQHS